MSTQGTLKGRSITVRLTSCLTSLEMYLRAAKIFSATSTKYISKLVMQEVNRTVILSL